MHESCGIACGTSERGRFFLALGAWEGIEKKARGHSAEAMRCLEIIEWVVSLAMAMAMSRSRSVSQQMEERGIVEFWEGG